MLKRLFIALMLSFIAFTSLASAEEIPATSGIVVQEKSIPQTLVVIVNQANQWDRSFWLGGIKDFFIDRYHYVTKPTQIEVITGSEKVNLSKDFLRNLAKEKKVDQVVVYVVSRADQVWLPSWHIGGHTQFESDDSYVTTIYLQGAIYQPSTDLYAQAKQWENTTDDNNMERLLVENTTKLMTKLEKKVPPLL